MAYKSRKVEQLEHSPMKVQILSKKFVKPLIPTPPDLRNYKISFADEVAPTQNVPVILYYPAANGNTTTASLVSESYQLEKSLEHILTRFYPLAGRYMKQSRVIDCNDQGVEYVVSKVNVQLHDLLDKGVEAEELNQLIPCELGAADEVSDPLLAIQVNIFECSGLAVSACFSHRIADGSTMASFICGWATVNQAKSTHGICPSFDAPSFFPGRGLDKIPMNIPRSMKDADFKSATKLFAFNKKAIFTLRAMSHGPRVSSLQLVNAILWKALIGVDRAKHGWSRASFLIQPVNLRGKTNPPLPQHTFGNLWGLATTQVKTGDYMAFQDFADLLGSSVRKYVKDCENVLSNGEDGHKIVIDPYMEFKKTVSNSQVHFCLFSSWCRFPFYEADFGLGKPIWTSVVNLPYKNFVILMDDKKGEGIEAWVHLDAADMPIFEQDSDIIAFATAAATAAKRPPIATDPIQTLLSAATLAEGPAASEGAIEIEGDGASAGGAGGDGGESPLAGAGAEAGGGITIGAGVGHGGCKAGVGDVAVGDGAGMADGDLETADPTNNATSIKMTTLQEAIGERERD
ncbi:hypothetical protein RJ639_033709 [Escallonia herrerae]|uniref:BAHD acyltransferase n=1 Tax=Escallonia herrerae TaxID=1293975 RepID=A0AA88WXJ7_9ASTE|nr:hypothetical protein RJ639_033709 [Escallonia herrerae]